MFISKAYAQVGEIAVDVTADMATMPEAPSATEAFAWNMGMIFVLVVLFYVLLIMPQQRRMKEHNSMLSGLKKGDRVVTGGGLIGKIDAVMGNDEVEIDLGNNVKVTALRSTINAKNDPLLKDKPANDPKATKKAPLKKKENAKKAPKKAAPKKEKKSS